jgi:rhodanese-related sulfurtransferase
MLRGFGHHSALERRSVFWLDSLLNDHIAINKRISQENPYFQNAMNITLIKPSEVSACDSATLFLDVRNPDEYEQGHIASSVLLPLPQVDPVVVRRMLPEAQRCVVVCKAGTRAQKAAQILADSGISQLMVLEGGMDAWTSAGLPVIQGSAGISIQSQTRFIAGFMVLLGVLLGVIVNKNWLYLSGFVGCGLMLAGLTGWCGLSLLLSKMPWNRNKACSCSR